MAHVTPLPGALSSPVVQGRRRGRRPGNVVSLQTVSAVKLAKQYLADQQMDTLIEKLAYHRAFVDYHRACVDQTLIDIQGVRKAHGIR